MNLNPITTNIILYCKEYENTVRFYRDRMHLAVTFSTNWFVEFRLNEMARISVADEKRTSLKSCSGQGMTLSLEVEDIQASWDDSIKSGLEPSAISSHPWSAKVFYLFDPEGHRLEIWQSI